jgi:hypothetical protein
VRKSPISSDSTFDHLIVTRYNVPISWGRRGQLHADEDWLEERQRLFERYCLPSVILAERSCPSVTWVLLCSVDSPASLRTFMEQVVQFHPWIVPMYVDENALISDIVDESLKKRTNKPCRFLLTTRLDSDDAVGRDFVKDLRQAAERSLELEFLGKRELPALINFPFGCQTVHGRLYFSADLGNPFISLLEERSEDEPIISCYLGTHRDLHKSARTVSQLMTSGPSWLQVIHGGNEANVVCGLRVPRRAGLKRFLVLRSEKRSQTDIGAVKEAARAIRNQTVQLGAYCWKRATVRINQSRERPAE